MKRLLASVWCGAVLACGGAVQTSPDGGTDGGSDAPVADGDAGFTKCRAPSGVSVCNGSENCGATCKYCTSGPPENSLSYCLEDIKRGGPDPEQCPDGYLLADHSAVSRDQAPSALQTECVHEDLAKLYALNGRLDMSRYADRSTYTGAPIPPAPTTCPKIAGVTLCGGACGGCPNQGQVCMGRSPLHPYSLCVDKFTQEFGGPSPCRRGNGNSCAGRRCLTFVVDAAAQTMADEYSMCIDASTCLAAEKAYPGGAVCTTGQF